MSPPRIGVVLSSGGTRGVYAHTGFLIALERLGIPVAAATGSSAGAVVGGMAASGTDLRAWAETIAHISPARFWRPAPRGDCLGGFLFPRGGGRGDGRKAAPTCGVVGSPPPLPRLPVLGGRSRGVCVVAVPDPPGARLY